MFDYSKRIEAFRKDRVRLLKKLKEKLFDHRKANRDRLIARLPERIEGVSISDGSFKPQGSVAIETIIQTKFKFEEYDIDDGLVLSKDDLYDEDGNELTTAEVREHVLQALKDKRFVKQPQLVTNAVRVFYKEDDEERHHIDIPLYRSYTDDSGNIVRELASESGWVESDPTQVNSWFNNSVVDRNEQVAGYGTQLRHLVQLIKRFCRSRKNWDMPNGMKLTMLVYECQPKYSERIDVAFRCLLEALESRLANSKVIRNLAHPDAPKLTLSDSDENVENFEDKVQEALEMLRSLNEEESSDERSARHAWDWIFKSDGYFSDFDKKERLEKKASLINSGQAKTTSLGIIVADKGIENLQHRFFGEEF